MTIIRSVYAVRGIPSSASLRGNCRTPLFPLLFCVSGATLLFRIELTDTVFIAVPHSVDKEEREPKKQNINPIDRYGYMAIPEQARVPITGAAFIA